MEEVVCGYVDCLLMMTIKRGSVITHTLTRRCGHNRREVDAEKCYGTDGTLRSINKR